MKKFNLKIIIAIIIALVIGLATVYSADSKTEFIYLSDIPYMEDLSFADGSNKIKLDENQSDDTIFLNIDGVEKPFIKGVTTWATSEIVYDLRDYDYDYFTAYLGVDASEKETYYNTGMYFVIYTSSDGENWGDPVLTSSVLDAFKPAEFVKIDIKNVNYLKLVAEDNHEGYWGPWYDEAVYADAKLIKETYVEDNTPVDYIKTVEEYDALVQASYSLDAEITGEYELNLLKRDFVENVGYDTLQAFVKVKDDYANVIKWLMNDADNLRLYIVGGTPDGSYVNSLKVLSDLYKTYGEDLNNENVTEGGVKLKDLYKKMMITLSLTHSADVGLWVTGPSGNPDAPNDSNAVNRYAIFKKLHSDGLLESEIFESLEVEEMRFVMNNIISDEEIVWLNAYSREVNSLDPYSYIIYGFGYDYTKDQYYDPNNYASWDAKYHLSEYNLTYNQSYPKLWIVFEEGGVCGAISKTGSNLRGVYGVPSTVIGQPGHAAYIYYSLNAKGEGVWNMYNDVSGWALSSRTEKLGIRMPNGWGIGSYASDYPVTYILLAQANLNDFEDYQKSEEILLLAEGFENNIEEQYKLYRKALDVNPLNFDAWLNLVNLYLVDSAKTETNYLKLVEEITVSLKYYPLPMYDLLRLIEPNITSNEGILQFTLLRKNALEDAASVTDDLSLQAFAVRQVANYLLGNIDSSVASFSFDGENAGKIILSEEKFGTSGVVWEYSLDGKETWTQTSNHTHQLTDTEINSINEENDINIHIVGTDYSYNNIYTIDITKASLPTKLYNNDYENKVIGATDTMQWRFNDTDAWTSFSTSEPDLTGTKAITVRVGNTDTELYSDSQTFYFTEDVIDDSFKYISIDRLSIADVSTEEPGRGEGATSAIDGNLNTIWHTLWNGSDTQKYITIKLDEPTYIAGIEYFQRQDTGSNGKVLNAKILVSEDGETWTEIVESTSWDMSKTAKKEVFAESIYAQYVKVVGVSTSGSYMAAAMINVYEDTTKIEVEPEPEPTPDPEPVPEPEDPEPDPEPTPTPEPSPSPEQKPEAEDKTETEEPKPITPSKPNTGSNSSSSTITPSSPNTNDDKDEEEKEDDEVKDGDSSEEIEDKENKDDKEETKEDTPEDVKQEKEKKNYLVPAVVVILVVLIGGLFFKSRTKKELI